MFGTISIICNVNKPNMHANNIYIYIEREKDKCLVCGFSV